MKLKYAFSSILVAILLGMALLTSVNVQAAEKSLETKPYMADMVVHSPLPTIELTKDLVKVWMEEMPTNLATKVSTAMKPTAEILKDMVKNMSEVAILTRDTKFREDWDFVRNLQRMPKMEIIGYDSDQQPLYVTMDKAKEVRWEGFVEFCKSDKAQAIIKKHRFVPLHHDKRV